MALTQRSPALVPIALLLLAGCVEQPAGLDISAENTARAPDYGYTDAFFMANSRPVYIEIQGSVPGMTAPELQASVVSGMRSTTHLGYFGGKYNWNFPNQAPVSFDPPILAVSPEEQARGITPPYHVVWRFEAATDRDVMAEATLYRGSEVLNVVHGHVSVRDDQAQPRAVPTLIETVESRLALILDAWVAPARGG
jgi:hypothetical protein